MTDSSVLEPSEQIENFPQAKKCWEILQLIKSQINDQIPLKEINNYCPSASEQQSIAYVRVFNGGAVDNLVHSLMLDQATGGAVMRLTAWLSDKCEAPHLTAELGAMPGFAFVYLDLLPRINPTLEPSYLERFYQPIEEIFLNLSSDSRLQRYVSRSLYMRQFQSASAMCFTVRDPLFFESLDIVCESLVSLWLGMIDSSPVKDPERRSILRHYTAVSRNNAILLDPDNQTAKQKLGDAAFDAVIKLLCGQGPVEGSGVA